MLREYQNLALVGFMGTGKSTVGHLLASLLDFRMVDTDALIEETSGVRISEIFAQQGEASFRDLESRTVSSLENASNLVISTGGGLVLRPENIASLQKHSLIVCLWASPEVIWERIRHQTHRPLLHSPDPLSTIRSLLAAREPFYRQADVLVNTETRSTREVARQILHHWHRVRQ